jgi:hypothetical protein
MNPPRNEEIKKWQMLVPLSVGALEIRCYMRNPDGHLIEVGQLAGVPRYPRTGSCLLAATMGDAHRNVNAWYRR